MTDEAYQQPTIAATFYEPTLLSSQYYAAQTRAPAARHMSGCKDGTDHCHFHHLNPKNRANLPGNLRRTPFAQYIHDEQYIRL